MLERFFFSNLWKCGVSVASDKKIHYSLLGPVLLRNFHVKIHVTSQRFSNLVSDRLAESPACFSASTRVKILNTLRPCSLDLTNFLDFLLKENIFISCSYIPETDLNECWCHKSIVKLGINNKYSFCVGCRLLQMFKPADPKALK